MLTTGDFVKKFDLYSDDSLIAINNDIESYGEDARTAVNIIIEKRGGLKKLLEQKENQNIIDTEISKIENETKLFARKKIDKDFIKTMLTSSIITKEDVDNIIDHQFSIIEDEIKNETVTGKTIVSSILGIVISSMVGGVLWGLQMMYTKRIFYIFLFGLAFLCYGIIKFITKKTSKNNAVFVGTIISIVCSVLLGYIMVSIFGYRD
jgi:hypothetical protein